MSKFQSKYTFNAKGILYIEDGVISVENSETGECVPITPFIENFNGKECAISINYAEDYGEA